MAARKRNPSGSARTRSTRGKAAKGRKTANTPSGASQRRKVAKAAVKKPAKKVQVVRKPEAFASFQQAFGIPQPLEPRRRVRELVRPPDFETAKDYAGTWKALAKALHYSESELKRLRATPDETVRQRVVAYINERQALGAHSKRDIQVFNDLRKVAGDLEFYPSYKTHTGRRNGPTTTGVYWTLNVSANPEEAIAKVIPWFESLRSPSSEFDLWYATGVILQWGGDNPRRATGKVALVMANGLPDKYKPEAKDFSKGWLGDIPVSRDKQQVIDSLQGELEALLEEDALTIVDWVTVRNYRRKTPEEVANFQENMARRYARRRKSRDVFKREMGLPHSRRKGWKR